MQQDLGKKGYAKEIITEFWVVEYGMFSVLRQNFWHTERSFRIISAIKTEQVLVFW